MRKTKQTRRVTLASCDTLIDAIPQLVWTAQPDGLHEYTNQRLRDYTGLVLEQIHDCWAHLGLRQGLRQTTIVLPLLHSQK
jgi:PAS domain-containing protein